MPVDNPFGNTTNQPEPNKPAPTFDELVARAKAAVKAANVTAPVVNPVVQPPPPIIPTAPPVVDEKHRRHIVDSNPKLARVTEILAEYNNIESDIPIGHEYWVLKHRINEEKDAN